VSWKQADVSEARTVSIIRETNKPTLHGVASQKAVIFILAFVRT
jgi:hypothetical protein